MWIKTQFDDIQFQIRELVAAQTLPWQNSQRRDNQELIPDLFHYEGGLFMSPFSLSKLLGCYSLCSLAPAAGLLGPLSGAAP